MKSSLLCDRAFSFYVWVFISSDYNTNIALMSGLVNRHDVLHVRGWVSPHSLLDSCRRILCSDLPQDVFLSSCVPCILISLGFVCFRVLVFVLFWFLQYFQFHLRPLSPWENIQPEGFIPDLFLLSILREYVINFLIQFLSFLHSPSPYLFVCLSIPSVIHLSL